MEESTSKISGTVLSEAMRKPYSVPGETSLLWKADHTVGKLLILKRSFFFMFEYVPNSQLYYHLTFLLTYSHRERREVYRREKQNCSLKLI